MQQKFVTASREMELGRKKQEVVVAAVLLAVVVAVLGQCV